MATRRLNGMRTLITGASGGIGTAITAAFLTEGAFVVGVGRQELLLKALVERIGATKSLHTMVADVGEADAATTVVDEAAKQMGGLDAVVNAAAVDTGWARAAEMDIAIW